MPFAEQLRNAIENCGLNQTILAKKAGITSKKVSNMLQGIDKYPSTVVLEKLENVLKTKFIIEPKPIEVEEDKNLSDIKFSSKKISDTVAMKVLHITSKNSLYRAVANGELPIGRIIHTDEGKIVLYISPRLFYLFTGFKYDDQRS